MIAKINTSGTHIQKDYLKVRIDLFPEPADKTYALHYVDEMIDSGEKDAEGNPIFIPSGSKQLNPCLCHFIKVDPDIDPTKLTGFIKKNFSPPILRQLDDLLSDPGDRRAEIGALMRSRLGSGGKVGIVDIDTLNSKLSSLEVKL